MSEQECLTANWYDQGYRDGVQGYPLARVEDHREACAKVGVVPQTQDYRRGHQKGVLEYCTPENAVAEGRRGRPYRNVCPAALESRFRINHERGLRVYHSQKRVDELDRESRRLEHAIDREKDDAKRRRLRRELRDLDRRLRDARDALRTEERLLRR